MSDYFQVSSVLEKVYRVMLLFVVISMMLPLKVNAGALGLLTIAWIATNPWKNFLLRLKEHKLALLMLGFYILYGLGLLYTVDQAEGWKEMEYKLGLLILPLVLATGPKLNTHAVRMICKVFYLATTALIFVGVGMAIQRVMLGTQATLMEAVTYRTFSEPIGFDPIYMAMYIILAIYSLVRDRWMDGQMRIINTPRFHELALLALFLVTLVFLSSRMEILVFICSLGYACMIYAWKSRRYLMPALVFAGTVISIYALISVNSVNQERFEEMVDMEADYTENKWGGRSVRIEKWKNAVECWSATPIIGAGTGDAMDELMKVYARNDFEIALFYAFNPHNQYLQTAITLGIVGVIWLLLLLAHMLWIGFKRHDMYFMLFAQLVTLSMITESMLERQQGIVFIVFFSLLLYIDASRVRELE